MSEHDAFLQAIVAAPEDDTPRLVYADWLDEHGDPERAEFIRLQCRLAKGCKACGGIGRNVMSPCACALLWNTGSGLLTRNTWRFLGDVAVLPGTPSADVMKEHRVAVYYMHPAENGSLLVTFRRGFVDSVRCSADAWFTYGPRLVRAAPLASVDLTHFRPQTLLIVNPRETVYVFPRELPGDLNMPREFWDAIYPFHANQEIALAVLSRCALAWARNRAGEAVAHA